MFDQLKIGNKASHDDFDATVKERAISKPKKKSIRETIPFSNIVYDFSAIDGEVYWEERDLQYVLEIIADTPEELEDKKIAFTSWIMNVMNEELYDPFIEDYHFNATYEDMDVEDDETVEKTTITVKFKAYPYMIANNKKVYNYVLKANIEDEVVISNKPAHPITPIIESDMEVEAVMDNASYIIHAGTTNDDSFKFERGLNVLKLKSSNNGEISFTFVEEVF